ncbi:hypothetical protein B0H14DRAFT_2587807 [Mycena olivaceomarginata]|nr:hypothetical protein B0H14DRAFT_2587807 [Mycena olivaceomarginata]
MCVASQYASRIPHLLTPIRPSSDLSTCLHQEETVQQICHACETVGLFYVKNHGIPMEVLQRCINESAKLFSLSDDTKMALWQEDPVLLNMGYRPSRDSKFDPNGTHNLVEGFTLNFGTFTILLQQPGIEALQVIAPKTGWTFIPPIAGTLIPHESFITPERPRQYEPMTSGEQFAKRIAESHSYKI